MIEYNISSTTGSFEVLGDLVIYPGDGKEFIRIGCTSGTYASLYFLNFFKVGNGAPQYADFSILSANVINLPTTVSTQYTKYYIPLMTSSPPIIFDLSECIPVENLVMQLEINAIDVTNSPGLQFVETG